MANTNPADKQAKLQDAMSRAKKLIQLESNGTLDKIAKGARDGINNSLSDGGNIISEQLVTTPRNRMAEAPIVGGQMGSNAANVPAAIRESFAKMSIDNSALYSAFGGGNGGNDDLAFLTEGLSSTPTETLQAPVQTQNVRQLVSEGLGETQPQRQYQSQQIDYPIIRTIVDEIVRKYTLSLKNKLINEGKQNDNQINTIAFGKTFKFLDNEGNIYECTMKKIGNVKNKKSVV